MKLRTGMMFWSIAAMMASPTEPLLAKEARPPRWSRDVLDTFFDDARDALNGPRPDYDSKRHPVSNTTVGASDGDAKDFAWSKLIESETLEAEIKRLNQAVASAVSKAGTFKGGGYQDASREFSELAVLFAVTAQYDGNARWKDAAPGIRDEFSRTAGSLKVGTDDSFRQATASSAVLADLVRGERPVTSEAQAEVSDWSQVAARGSLMQRLEAAHQKRLSAWLADPATFRRRQHDVVHEAQIIAMLAEVIQREAFEFADDDTFVEYAKGLEQAAVELSTAAASGNLMQAQAANVRATKSCADCHDGYRG